jgi:hypothetical protein
MFNPGEFSQLIYSAEVGGHALRVLLPFALRAPPSLLEITPTRTELVTFGAPNTQL